MSEFIPNSYQTPNAYVDQYMHLLTPEEWKTLCYAVRRILGFNKRQDRISLGQFMNGLVSNGKQLDYGTGLCESAQREALKGLKKYKLLVEVAPNDPQLNQGPLYELQIDSKKVEQAKLVGRWETKQKQNSLRTKKARATALEKRKNTPPSVGQHPPLSDRDDPLLSDNTTPPLSDRDTITSRKPVEKQVVVNSMINTHAENDIEKTPALTAAAFQTEQMNIFREFYPAEKLTTKHVNLINSCTNLEALREMLAFWKPRYPGNQIENMVDRYSKINARMTEETKKKKTSWSYQYEELPPLEVYSPENARELVRQAKERMNQRLRTEMFAQAGQAA